MEDCGGRQSPPHTALRDSGPASCNVPSTLQALFSNQASDARNQDFHVTAHDVKKCRQLILTGRKPRWGPHKAPRQGGPACGPLVWSSAISGPAVRGKGGLAGPAAAGHVVEPRPPRQWPANVQEAGYYQAVPSDQGVQSHRSEFCLLNQMKLCGVPNFYRCFKGLENTWGGRGSTPTHTSSPDNSSTFCKSIGTQRQQAIGESWVK